MYISSLRNINFSILIHQTDLKKCKDKEIRKKKN